MAELKDLRSLIDRRFRQYLSIKKAVYEIRNDSNRPCNTGGQGSAYISDPTANEAIKHVSHIARVMVDGHTVRSPEQWVEVFDQTQTHYRHDRQTSLVIDHRYIHNEYYIKTCAIIPISKSEYYNTVYDVTSYALAVACQVGLIKVY